MRTIYGIVPALTPKGFNSGRFAPVAIDIPHTTDQDIGKALSRVRELLPNDPQDPNTDEFRIDLQEGVRVGSISETLHVPKLQIRIRPNFGLEAGKLKSGSDFGIAEIVAEDETPRKRSERGYVVARDKDIRSGEGDVTFTDMFMRRTIEHGLDVGGFIPSEHHIVLVQSLMDSAKTNEGAWMGHLSEVDPNPRKRYSLNYLREMAAPTKEDGLPPTMLGVEKAVLTINETVAVSMSAESLQMEGGGRKELL